MSASQPERSLAGSEETKEGENTDRRQEGEEVILLIVDDIPGVLLLPFFWVAKPHSSGMEVTHSTASWPGAAPESGNQMFQVNTFTVTVTLATQKFNGYREFC